MAPCDGPLLHGNGSVSALELSMQMQPKASSKEGSEIHCMAPPFPEDGDGEETAPWEWESVSEPGGYPIIIQVVLSDPSLSCVHCAAAEVPSARPKLQMQSEEFCPRLEPLCTSGYTASQKLEKDPAPVEEDRVPGQTVPEIWDLEACQGEEPKAGYERPATSEAGSEGHTRGWRHVLTPVSSPFSLACSEDSSQGLSGSKSMEQQVREVTLSDADVSSFDLQALAEQEPVGELAPLRSAQDCVPQKPTRSVHSVETGVGTGSSDVRTPIPPFGRTSHSSQKGVTPLHFAAEAGSTEFVETLLRFGATVDAPTSDGFIPLHSAANMGRVEADAAFSLACSEDSSQGLSGSKSMEQQVREVTLSDADVSSFDLQALAEQEPVGELAPLRSAQDCVPQKPTRSVHSVETGVGTGSSDVRTPIPPFGRTSHSSQKGVTPLHFAAEAGSTEFVETLLRSGATVDAPTSDGFIPLHSAANMGRIEADAAFSLACSEDSSQGLSGSKSMEQQVREVTLSDADVSSFDLQALAEQEPVGELAPLRSAQDCVPQKPTRSVHSVETGVGTGSSDVRTPIPPFGRTSHSSQKGVTPLHVAAETGVTEVVETLLRSGATVDAPTSDGFTPLHGAATLGRVEAVASLIAARADPSLTAGDGSSALHGAARNGHTETVALLLEKGSVVDVRDRSGGFTPLHDAAHAGHLPWCCCSSRIEPTRPAQLSAGRHL